MNIQQMMKQAQQMQERLQKQMADLRVEGNAGGGMVTVVSFCIHSHHHSFAGYADVLGENRADVTPPTVQSGQNRWPTPVHSVRPDRDPPVGVIRDDVGAGALMMALHGIGAAHDRPDWRAEADGDITLVLDGLRRSPGAESGRARERR